MTRCVNKIRFLYILCFGPIAFARADDYPALVSAVGIEPKVAPPSRDPAPAAPAETSAAAESTVAEPTGERPRYVLGRPLAQGGMAALYHGKRIVPGGFIKQIVLKRLRPELSQNADATALFLREAGLAATLEHPAIVRTLDLTQIDGVLYLVLEYVRGGDLRLVLRRAKRRNQRFTPAAALYIGRELCAALEYTHGRRLPDGRPLGLVHRDISPTNVLLSIDGEVKLTDFGIAQADAQLGSDPRARGHVGYMSPEQARGDALDARSDLFSLAAVLYEVFTDRRLFVGLVGQRPTEVYGEVVPPSHICADLPPDLDAVLLRALALPAAERQPSANVLYQNLLEIAKRSGLYLDRSEFAAHLHAVCGADPAEWASLEERTATALIASISLDSIADHDDPSASGLTSGRLVQALTINATGGLEKITPPPEGELSEPSEPAITVPWPTVPAAESRFSSGVPLVESDDTMPFPSGPVAIPGSRIADHIDPLLLAFDLDADAVTGPAVRTVSPDKLHDEELPGRIGSAAPRGTGAALLSAAVAQHQAHLAQAAERHRVVRRFSRARRASFAYGLFAGLIISLLLLWMLANRPFFGL